MNFPHIFPLMHYPSTVMVFIHNQHSMGFCLMNNIHMNMSETLCLISIFSRIDSILSAAWWVHLEGPPSWEGSPEGSPIFKKGLARSISKEISHLLNGEEFNLFDLLSWHIIASYLLNDESAVDCSDPNRACDASCRGRMHRTWMGDGNDYKLKAEAITLIRFPK